MSTPTDFAGLFHLSNRVAIVTGASSGLGRRFALVLAGAGAKVGTVARRADRLDTLAATHHNITVFPCDVTNEAERKNLVASVLRTHVQRNCPMQRLGEPHELDAALLFLAEDGSRGKHSCSTEAGVQADNSRASHQGATPDSTVYSPQGHTKTVTTSRVSGLNAPSIPAASAKKAGPTMLTASTSGQ